MSRPTAQTPTIERRLLRDGVYDAILSRLLDGSHQPGAILAIDPLARELGVSPTPVREALAELEHTGLLTRTALKGYRIAPPLTANAMAELVDARLLLELGAVNATTAHLNELKPHLRAAHDTHYEVLQQIPINPHEPVSTGAIREHFRADWGFHRTILQHCGNRFIQSLVESLAPQVHRMRQAINHGVTDAWQAFAEHQRILDAFLTNDIDRATEQMRQHLLAVRQRAISDS